MQNANATARFARAMPAPKCPAQFVRNVERGHKRTCQRDRFKLRSPFALFFCRIPLHPIPGTFLLDQKGHCTGKGKGKRLVWLAPLLDTFYLAGGGAIAHPPIARSAGLTFAL